MKVLNHDCDSKTVSVLTAEVCLLQIAHPRFLHSTVPVLEEQQVRLVHARPGFDNLSMHSDVFNQAGLAARAFTPCLVYRRGAACKCALVVYDHFEHQ